jgi:hypothetical protein
MFIKKKRLVPFGLVKSTTDRYSELFSFHSHLRELYNLNAHANGSIDGFSVHLKLLYIL